MMLDIKSLWLFNDDICIITLKIEILHLKCKAILKFEPQEIESLSQTIFTILTQMSNPT